MRRVSYGIALASMLASTLLLGVATQGAGAADLAASGWWWRAQGGTGLAPNGAPPLPGTPVPVPTAPAPPTVPEGGLMVAGTPEGATAIAALRFLLSEDETMPVLKLAIERESGGAAAVMAACVTGSAWEPVAAGAWSDKPFAACAEGSVNGVLADDGASFTFALGPLLADGLIDVVLVPGVVEGAPDGANGSPFEVVFQAPTAASLQTTQGSAPETTSFDVPTIGEESGGGDAGGGGFDAPGDGGGTTFDAPSTPSSAGGFSSPSTGGASFSAPSTPDPSAAAGGFTAALEPEEQGLTFTAPAVEQASRPISSTPDEGTDARLLAGFVLALGAAAIVWSTQQAAPGPAGLLARFGAGPAATTPAIAGMAAVAVDAGAPTPGGIGRFARVRTGTPPRL